MTSSGSGTRTPNPADGLFSFCAAATVGVEAAMASVLRKFRRLIIIVVNPVCWQGAITKHSLFSLLIHWGNYSPVVIKLCNNRAHAT